MIATIILMVLMAMGLGSHIVKHGETKKSQQYNMFHYLIKIGVFLTLYYYTGMFNDFH